MYGITGSFANVSTPTLLPPPAIRNNDYGIETDSDWFSLASIL
jgi:hypothetical protein